MGGFVESTWAAPEESAPVAIFFCAGDPGEVETFSCEGRVRLPPATEPDAHATQ